MKRILVAMLILVLSALLLVGACAEKAAKEAPAQKPAEKEAAKEVPTKVEDSRAGWPDMITIGTKAAPSINYIISAAMMEMVQKHVGLKATVEPFASGAVITRYMRDGQVDIGAAGSDSSYAAFHATTYMAGEKKGLNLRLWMLGSTMWNPVLAHPKSGIETPADLRGKKWAYNNPVSGFKTELAELVLAAYGMTPNDVQRVKITGSKDVVTALREGLAEASWWSLAVGTPWAEDLLSTGDLKLIPMGEKEIAYVVERNGCVYPAVIPGGTFGGHDQDIPTVGFANLYLMSSDVPESLGYAITKAIYDNFDEFLSYAATNADFALPGAIEVANIPVPVHKGAIKYFKEKGYWTSQHEARQKALLAEEGLAD